LEVPFKIAWLARCYAVAANTPQAGGHVGDVESVGVVGLGHAKIAVRDLAFLICCDLCD
jgi:hypothetical protein